MTTTPHIIRTGTSYTAEIHGRIRTVSQCIWSDGSKSIEALCDIIQKDGKKFVRKVSR